MSARPLGRGAGLGLGVAMIWFSLLILIPLAAIIVKAAGGGPSTFGHVLTESETRDALLLTVKMSVIVTIVNVVVGTLIAWELVRDRPARARGAAAVGEWFWGKVRVVIDLVIDIPFALPTIVAGLVLLSLYGPHSPLGLHWAPTTQKAILVAIAFVTLPFVVRTVQPVLEELDTDVEDAAASLGAGRLTILRRIVLPSVLPAIFAGASLSFARGLSEYGSLVLLSSNSPHRTETVSVRLFAFIEQSNTRSAAALATILLVVALLAIVVLDVVQRRVARRG
ncbi:ABC transporter permease subunit [Nocardioides sp. BP30]|uniref:ABC transporter permease n=1 Tax=Nocardioides sp. BP30 TaxID=3036374 RepID=UPI0024697265|nr:ABC transporter permease subunit [Nocardioides sp. BP30]WGL52962.1 ABC transporter permease subunit [Nocardioides sp. BP30]